MNLNKTIYNIIIMSYISQVKKSTNSLKFRITNKKDELLEIALINAIRRSIIVNLEGYAFLRDTINFSVNTSIYNEDFLSQRVSLIPLNYSKLDKLNISEIEGNFEASNDDPIEFKRFYAKDIKLYYGPLDVPIEERKSLDDIYPIPDVLLLELKPNQKVKFTIRIGKGTHKENGASFCPISKCLYYFEPDSKELSKVMAEVPEERKRELEPLNRDKCYMKTAKGIPLIYNFELENDGVIPIVSLFERACDYLINLLDSKINEIKNIEVSKTVAIETSPTNMKGYDFVFENSNETLGNLMQSYGLRDKDIHYIAYQVPHPSDKRLYVRISLDESAERKDYEKKVIGIMQQIITILNGLKKDYMSSV